MNEMRRYFGITCHILVDLERRILSVIISGDTIRVLTRSVWDVLLAALLTWSCSNSTIPTSFVTQF